MKTSLHHIQGKERRRTSMGVELVSMVEAQSTDVGVHLGLQEQPWLKSTPRLHTNSVFDNPHMLGKPT
jgi:hypothetical protein